MSTPRVVMLVQNFYPSIGGAERQALELSRVLIQKKNVAVTVLTQGVKNLPSSEVVSGVPVRRLGVGSVSFLVSSFFWLLIHSSDYDVIHVHLASSHAVGAALAGRILRKKVIVKLSGSKVVGEMAVSHQSFLGRLKLRALGLLKPRLVLVSPAQRDDLHGFGLEMLETRLIPNGVDADRFFPTDQGRKNSLRAQLGWEGLIFLFVGRFSPDKLRSDIFQNFLTAWARVLKSGRPMSFYLVGKGELEEAYRAAIERMGLQDSVYLWPARDSVLDLYQAADVFVLPSITEGLSNAMLEAMAAGLPILGSRVEGIREVIKDGVSGVLFNPLSVEEIGEALNKVIGNSGKLAEMAKQSRKTAASYTIEANAEAHLKLYSADLSFPRPVSMI